MSVHHSVRTNHNIRLGRLFPEADRTCFLVLSMCNQAHIHARRGSSIFKLAAY